jgi:hypothetical protein
MTVWLRGVDCFWILTGDCSRHHLLEAETVIPIRTSLHSHNFTVSTDHLIACIYNGVPLNYPWPHHNKKSLFHPHPNTLYDRQYPLIYCLQVTLQYRSSDLQNDSQYDKPIIQPTRHLPTHFYLRRSNRTSSHYLVYLSLHPRRRRLLALFYQSHPLDPYLCRNVFICPFTQHPQSKQTSVNSATHQHGVIAHPIHSRCLARLLSYVVPQA